MLNKTISGLGTSELDILVKATTKYLGWPCGEISYQDVADDLRRLSGAAYTVINTFEKDAERTVTRAIGGLSKSVQWAERQFGFPLVGRKWVIDEMARKTMATKRVICFGNPSQMDTAHVPSHIGLLLEKGLNLGPVYGIGITRGDELVGNFYLFMSRGKQLTASQLVEVFASQVGAILLRHRAEVALQDNRTYVQQIIKNSPNAIAVLDQRLHFILVSTRFCSDYQVAAHDVLGRFIYDVFPDLPQHLRAVHSRCLGGAVEWGEEEGFPQRDGSFDWINWECRPWYRSDNTIGGIIIYSEIVTEGLRAKRELNYQKQFFESLFKNSPDAIASLDAQHKVVDINEPFGRLFGYVLEELQGHDLDDFLAIGSVENEARQITQQVMIGNSISQESIRYNKAGEPVYVNVRGIPVTINGELVGGFAIYTDISQRKEYEEKLTHLSYHDSLTGLYNRTFFDETMIQQNAPDLLPTSIIMIDMNNLKLVNDAFGHRVGDELLVQTAQLLRENCRGTDLIARVGGDEFIIFLPQTEPSVARRIVDRIEAAFDQAPAEPVQPQIAVGYATRQDLSVALEDVVNTAETNMYAHKLVGQEKSRRTSIEGLCRTLGATSPATEKHAQRLKELAGSFGRYLGLGKIQLEDMTRLALLHDVGKITLPVDILEKPGPLTVEEWEKVRKHAETGYRIASFADLTTVAEAILAHHERWDGQGYPRGLAGEEIPYLARVLAILDAYDAIIAGRPYQKAMPPATALAEIERCCGTQFDPNLGMEFIRFQRGEQEKHWGSIAE